MQIELLQPRSGSAISEASLGDALSVGRLPDVTAPGGQSLFRVARAEFSAVRISTSTSAAPAPGDSPLQRINDYFQGREASLARQMRASVDRRDMIGLVDETLRTQDLATEIDLGSKVVAKAVSALGQLTNMT